MKNISILVVDDFASNRILIVDLLEDFPEITTYEAKNGLEALEIIKVNKVDIVLLDIEMPVMNGFETAWYIRNELLLGNEAVKIYALTAHPLEYVRENPNFEYFDGVISKPYTIDKLNDIINKL